MQLCWHLTEILAGRWTLSMASCFHKRCWHRVSFSQCRSTFVSRSRGVTLTLPRAVLFLVKPISTAGEFCLSSVMLLMWKQSLSHSVNFKWDMFSGIGALAYRLYPAFPREPVSGSRQYYVRCVTVSVTVGGLWLDTVGCVWCRISPADLRLPWAGCVDFNISDRIDMWGRRYMFDIAETSI